MSLLATMMVAGAIVASLSGHDARSQAPPTLKIVTPTPPGGANDLIARLMGEQIGRAQGVAVVIENRPGAGTVIGTEAVARSAPDGTTLLITSPPFVINPHLRRVNYDPLTSFEPICTLAVTPTMIVVNGGSPYRTLADLLDAARAKPGELTMASIGPGTGSHIAFEMLARLANIKMTFVPYPGTAPAAGALLGEHVTSAFIDYPTAAEHVKAGRLRALAVASPARIAPLPELPTVAESFKDYDADLWYGIVAPAKTPKETIAQLEGWFTAALQAPELKPKLALQAFYPVGICGVQSGAHLRRKFEEYGSVIREANIRAAQ
jgi:tripartite-type tricarboxylate transporter receptor subunit TctC